MTTEKWWWSIVVALSGVFLGWIAAMILADKASAAVLPQPCPLVKHHGKAITPIQSCVLERPLVVQAAPEPDPQEIGIVTRYQVIEAPQPCSVTPRYTQASGWDDWFGGTESPRYYGGGVAMRAPEIDPNSAMTALTMLVGCLVVMRSKP